MHLTASVSLITIALLLQVHSRKRYADIVCYCVTAGGRVHERGQRPATINRCRSGVLNHGMKYVRPAPFKPKVTSRTSFEHHRKYLTVSGVD
jgi:hypothetical protein